MKRIALGIVGTILLLLGLASLFPFQALNLISGMYTVGLSISFHRQLSAFGSAAVVGALWAFASAVRASS